MELDDDVDIADDMMLANGIEHVALSQISGADVERVFSQLTFIH